MLVSPFSKEQLKNADKVIIAKITKINDKIDFTCIYIDRKGRHEHTLTYTRNSKEIWSSIYCPCTSCMRWQLRSGKWCIFKIRVAKELVTMKIFKHHVLTLINGE